VRPDGLRPGSYELAVAGEGTGRVLRARRFSHRFLAACGSAAAVGLVLLALLLSVWWSSRSFDEVVASRDAVFALRDGGNVRLHPPVGLTLTGSGIPSDRRYVLVPRDGEEPVARLEVAGSEPSGALARLGAGLLDGLGLRDGDADARSVVRFAPVTDLAAVPGDGELQLDLCVLGEGDVVEERVPVELAFRDFRVEDLRVAGLDEAAPSGDGRRYRWPAEALAPDARWSVRVDGAGLGLLDLEGTEVALVDSVGGTTALVRDAAGGLAVEAGRLDPDRAYRLRVAPPDGVARVAGPSVAFATGPDREPVWQGWVESEGPGLTLRLRSAEDGSLALPGEATFRAENADALEEVTLSPVDADEGETILSPRVDADPEVPVALSLDDRAEGLLGERDGRTFTLSWRVRGEASSVPVRAADGRPITLTLLDLRGARGLLDLVRKADAAMGSGDLAALERAVGEALSDRYAALWSDRTVLAEDIRDRTARDRLRFYRVFTSWYYEGRQRDAIAHAEDGAAFDTSAYREAFLAIRDIEGRCFQVIEESYKPVDFVRETPTVVEDDWISDFLAGYHGYLQLSLQKSQMTEAERRAVQPLALARLERAREREVVLTPFLIEEIRSGHLGLESGHPNLKDALAALNTRLGGAEFARSPALQTYFRTRTEAQLALLEAPDRSTIPPAVGASAERLVESCPYRAALLTWSFIRKDHPEAARLVRLYERAEAGLDPRIAPILARRLKPQED
jgi:hypothetical protein